MKHLFKKTNDVFYQEEKYNTFQKLEFIKTTFKEVLK